MVEVREHNGSVTLANDYGDAITIKLADVEQVLNQLKVVLLENDEEWLKRAREQGL